MSESYKKLDAQANELQDQIGAFLDGKRVDVIGDALCSVLLTVMNKAGVSPKIFSQTMKSIASLYREEYKKEHGKDS